ncbi:hypothetical protein D3C86_1571870 [compost metagenome]
MHEGLADGLGVALVHGEAQAAVVHGRAHLAVLVDDGVAVVLLPLPDPLDEGVAAQVVTALALFVAELALDHVLGGDAGVVGAALPEDAVALHAARAAQHVLDGAVGGVAQVQGAGHVRRGQDDGEGLLGRIHVHLEDVERLPAIAPPGLDGCGLVGGGHLWGGGRGGFHGASEIVRDSGL